MPVRSTVAVLGASGFIGSRLVERLILGDLATVRPIVRSFKGMARSSRFSLDCRVADATSRESLASQLSGCEVLFHCVVGDRDTIMKSADAAYRAAADAGVKRLVYLSSAVVHGNSPAPGTTDEHELIEDQAFEYNVSKVMAEHLLRRLGADRAVEIVTLRPFIVYGPRSTYWTFRVATELLNATAYLVDGGAGICNTVYVDNLVRAMWLAAISDKAANQAFIITDGERVTWKDLYAGVAEAVEVDMSQVYDIDGARLLRHPRVNPLRMAAKVAVKLVGHAAKQTLPPVTITIGKKILPRAVKRAMRQRWETAHETPNGTNSTSETGRRFPVVDRQIVDLQSCRYMLPIGKAQALLGYQPEVSFAEGCRRTKEWLRFVMGDYLADRRQRGQA